MVSRVGSDQLSFSEVACDSIRLYLTAIVKQWEGVHGGKDVDAVHDMRVATRRLRAALSVFQPIFPPRLFERFERKISYLTDALGEARDTDVFLEFLKKESSELTVDRTNEEFGLHEFIKHLQKQREQQQQELLKTLKRLDPGELENDGLHLLESVHCASPHVGGSIDV